MSGFDICGPLPEGTTVLEASAGTGKTYTIAALTTRYVAEGLADLSELLLVTFGRAATSELRDRVRERLVRTERALRDPSAARAGTDPLVRHLAARGELSPHDASPDDATHRRRRRLTRALAQFDSATITTTHGFCQQMLATLGTAADVDRDAILVPDVSDLQDEVLDDVYLRLYASAPQPALSVDDARKVARAAIGDPDATLRPDAAEPGSEAWHRYRFAVTVREELVRRKRARRILDYDDLLVLLRAALDDPHSGPDAADRVRSRYRVVMVDEFQDTDQVQWDILRTAFHGHRTLVLIGDPKQAIYAFRGADVATYLAAREHADATQTLTRNWRADDALVRGLGHVLGAVTLGDPRIVVRPVEAQHAERRLVGLPAVRVRQVTTSAMDGGARTPRGKFPAVAKVRGWVYRDVAAQVVEALGAARLRPGAPADRTGADGWRALRPGDIAVLARRNADATAVRSALAEAGVPAVVSAQASVFGTEAARQWLTLLTALSQPGDAQRVAAAALTPFLGWDARRLAEETGAVRDALAERVRAWARVLAARGVAALLEAANSDGLSERLVRRTTGERELTDVRHIAESLHAAATTHRLGVAALTEWLRARIEDADDDYADERSRRLETDAAAVQVLTVHSSKGLEFPVVFVPFAWDRYEPRTPDVLSYHDDDGLRLLDVGGPGSPGYQSGLQRHQAEDRGEDLRLAYVAMTRASSQVVLWWAPSNNSSGGALTRLMLGKRSVDGDPPASVRVPDDDAATRALAALAAASEGALAHEVVDRQPPTLRWEPSAKTRPPLSVARFERHLDADWRRLSYSGLTAAAHQAALVDPGGHGTVPGLPGAPGPPGPPGEAAADESMDEPENAGVQDEPALRVPLVIGQRVALDEPASRHEPEAVDEHALRAVRSPMADLPGGAAFGTLTHEVLERVDTASADLPRELRERCAESGLSTALGIDELALAESLLPVLETPLGALAEGLTLRQIAPRDRLAELAFELPLSGGDRHSAPARPGTGPSGGRLRDVGALLRHHLPADDVFAPYADRLDHPDLPRERLRGYLTGSIDVVLRVRSAAWVTERGTEPEPRYLVVDYKTNRLAAQGEALTAWHYRPEAMVREMLAAHYPLQLLLYAVALHRYLRWRQPGYDPHRHLGGGLYLFVRGMSGPGTPVIDGAPCGVMAWRPPAELIIELSALLDGRPR